MTCIKSQAQLGDSSSGTEKAMRNSPYGNIVMGSPQAQNHGQPSSTKPIHTTIKGLKNITEHKNRDQNDEPGNNYTTQSQHPDSVPAHLEDACMHTCSREAVIVYTVVQVPPCQQHFAVVQFWGSLGNA
jgi:hypothetical protein